MKTYTQVTLSLGMKVFVCTVLQDVDTGYVT